MKSLYRLLLLLYPWHIRREYSEEMASTFQAKLDSVRESQGSFRAALYGLRSLFGVVTNAALEHRDHRRTRAASAGGAGHHTPGIGERWMLGMGKLWGDVKYAARQLVRAPGFTVVALASLALGIGANSAIFSIVNAVFLRPLPVHNAGELYEIYTFDSSNAGLNMILISIPNYEDLEEEAQTFSSLSAYSNVGFTYTVDGADPDQTAAAMVTGRYFETLGIQPHLGRLLNESDSRVMGASPVVVLSHALWMRIFGGDPGAVGRTMTLNGHPFTVVGVTPQEFNGTASLGQRERVWIPLEMRNEVLPEQSRHIFELRRALPLVAVGRVASGVTREQAQSELTTIAARLEDTYPDDNHDRTFSMVPLAESAVGVNQRDNLTQSAMLLMSIVGLVLLIACANLANLLLARSAGRARELGLRASLGASRWDLTRQMLTESLMLAGLGGLLGLAVAVGGSRLLLVFRPQFIPPDAIDATLDGRVLAFTMLVSIVTGLIFGLLPAVRASSPKLHEILKESSRGSGAGSSRSKLRSGLVIAEVALAIVGLMGAGLFIRSMQNASSIDPGWEAEGLFAIVMNPGAAGYPQSEVVNFLERAIEVGGAVPGVSGLSAAAHFPLSQPAARTFQPESPDVPLESASFIGRMPIMPGYFELMGMPLADGRWLTDDEYRPDGAHSAMVNQATVRRYWPNGGAVGQRFTFFNDPRVFEIVGVVEDVTLNQLGGEVQPAVFFPYAKSALPFFVIHGRTAGDVPAVMAEVRDQIRELDRSILMQEPQSADQIFAQTLWPRRMGAALLSIFATLAMVMAAAGIHAVMSYVSALRRHEIGIRLALGAEPRGVLWMVLRQGMTLVVVGALLGVAVTVLGGRFVAGMLYDVQAADPVTLLIVPGVLGLVALIACGVPAWRSTRTNPVEALQRN